MSLAKTKAAYADMVMEIGQGLMPVLDALMGILKPIISFLGEYPGIIYAIVGAFAVWKIVTIAQSIATGIATAAQWAFNVATTANPIGIIIVLIAAFVAGMAYLIYQLWEGEGVMRKVAIAIFALMGPIGWVILAIRYWGDIIDWIVEKFWWLMDSVWGVLEAIGGFFSDLGGWIWDGLTSIWDSITGFFGDIWDWISGFFGDLFDSAYNWGKDLLKGFWDGLKSMWNSVTGFFSDLWDAILDFIGFDLMKNDLKVERFGSDMIHHFVQGEVKALGREQSTMAAVGDNITTSMVNNVGGTTNIYGGLGRPPGRGNQTNSIMDGMISSHMSFAKLRGEMGGVSG